MAEKPEPKDQAEETTEQAEEELEATEESTARSVGRRFLKLIAFLLIALGIVAAGFFAGVYLRVFDVYEVNEKIDLYAMPFVGEYFVEPVKKLPGVVDEYVIRPAQ